MKPDCGSRCATFRRAPASGTRSSTDCSRFISQNWRGKPLLSYEVIVNLIAATTTSKGLKVHAELDSGTYRAGTKVDDHELAGVRLHRDKFHGDWNYEIHPHRTITG